MIGCPLVGFKRARAVWFDERFAPDQRWNLLSCGARAFASQEIHTPLVGSSEACLMTGLCAPGPFGVIKPKNCFRLWMPGADVGRQRNNSLKEMS